MIRVDKNALAKYDILTRLGEPYPIAKSIRGKLEPLYPLTASSLLGSHHVTDGILNTIREPSYWEAEDGQLWKQTISYSTTIRPELVALQEDLDLRLDETQARTQGVCPFRRVLFTQLFDEILRQVTLECYERGHLLSRCRKHFLFKLDALDSIYGSSIQYGIDLANKAKEDFEKYQERLNHLENKRTILKEIVNENKKDSLLRHIELTEKKGIIQVKHNDKMTTMLAVNKQLGDLINEIEKQSHVHIDYATQAK